MPMTNHWSAYRLDVLEVGASLWSQQFWRGKNVIPNMAPYGAKSRLGVEKGVLGTVYEYGSNYD